jgi:hypothetical protein
MKPYIPATEAARQWQGWGSALKPALEPITVARKPLIGTIAENVLQYGTGAINVDGCRVAHNEPLQLCKRTGNLENGMNKGNAYGVYNATNNNKSSADPAGRWPANLIHDGSLDVVKELKSAARFFYTAKAGKKDRDCGLGGIEIISIFALWENEDLIAKLLVDTEQSPPRVTAEFTANNKNGLEWNTLLFGSLFTDLFQKDIKSITSTETSSTTKSKTLNALRRFIINGCIQGVSLDPTDGINRAANAEQSTTLIITISEKTALAHGVNNAALPMRLKISASEGRNIHSTVKPLLLMQYLVRLVTPPGGVVLDPFMGSGTTGLACRREGFDFIGMEREAAYFQICKNRIENDTDWH